MDSTPFKINTPYLESIPVGTGAPPPALIAGYRYIYYSSPIADDLLLCGFNANFYSDLATVRIQLSDIDERDVWTPFYTMQTSAIFGAHTQAEPVLWLPRPYLLKPGHRVQFDIQNPSVSNISSTIITLVGVRQQTVEVVPCFN